MHEEHSDPPIPPGQPVHVLVVEDDPLLRRSTGRNLQRRGFRVLLASEASEAIEAVRHSYLDVVVSDVWLPGLDGLQLTEAIRRIDAEMPIVLLTGDPEAVSETRIEELRVLSLFIKPFDCQALDDALRKASRTYRTAKLRREAG